MLLFLLITVLVKWGYNYMTDAQNQLLDFPHKNHSWFQASARKSNDDHALAFSVFTQLDVLIKKIHNQCGEELDCHIKSGVDQYIPEAREAWYTLEVEREKRLCNKLLSTEALKIDSYYHKVSQLIEIEARVSSINRDSFIAIMGTGPCL